MSKKQKSAPLVVGIDLGTTRVKAIAFEPGAGTVVAATTREYPTRVTPNGGSEQNPEDWWAATTAACQQLVKEVGPQQITAVGLSGHMHGLLLLDRHLDPLRPAMTWSDRRVGDSSRELAKVSQFRELGGNDVVEAFTAPKLHWLSQKDPELINNASHMLLSKDYLGLRLTGVISTDVTDAMGTLLWDVKSERWDPALFGLCGAPDSIAPDVVASSSVKGMITAQAAQETGLPLGTPVIAGAGDVSAAALGCGLWDSTTAGLNAGTAAQALSLVSELDGGSGFIFGSAWGDGHVAMSSVYAAGASIAWAERVLLASESIERSAGASPPGAGGLTYLPYMSGIAVPRKDDTARAAFVGQNSSHSPEHLAAAVLEGVAFACADALEAVMHLTGNIQRVHVVGGVANSTLWRQALASVLDVDVIRLPEGGSAIGAALLATIGAEIASPLSALDSLTREPTELPDDETVNAYRTARDRFIAARDTLT